MKRKIAFRGIRKGDNTWLYGDLVHINGECHIFPEDAPNSPDYYEVISESVGQFTGFMDMNCVDIFEGDVLKGRSGKIQGVRSVHFDEGKFVLRTLTWSHLNDLSEAFDREDSHIVVIGNLHQMPINIPL